MARNDFMPLFGRRMEKRPHSEERPHPEAHPHPEEHGQPHKHRRNPDYDRLEIDEKLIINLRDIGHTLRVRDDGRGGQKRILIILSKAICLTQRELTDRIGVKPGTMSEVIGKLEAAGLIERETNPTDRRTVDITLTDAGRELALEAERERTRRHEEMLSCLTEEEKESLLAITEKLNAQWELGDGSADGSLYSNDGRDEELDDRLDKALGC